MTLRTKVFIANGLGLLIVCWLLKLVTSSILTDGFLSVERDTTRLHGERAIDALIEEETNVCRADWAAWDDLYGYVANRNRAFQASNLVADTFGAMDIEFIGIYDAQGQEVWAGWRDEATLKLVAVPGTLKAHLQPNSYLFRHAAAKELKSGLLVLANGAFVVGSRPIVKSDFSGKIRGTLVMVRRLSQERLKRLSERVHLDIRFRALAQSKPAQQVSSFPFLSGSTADVVVDPESENRVSGLAVLPDIYGKSAMSLEVSTSRTVYQKGRETLASLLWGACGVALFFVALCVFLVERLVLRRLGKIVLDIKRITGSGERSSRATCQGSDELGQVTLAINEMLAEAEAADLLIRDSEVQARRATQMHEIASRRFAELFEGLPVACFSYDSDGMIHEWNRASELLWGIPAPEAVFRPIHEVLDCIDQEGAEKFVERVFAGERLGDVEWEGTTRDGRQMWLYTATIPLLDSTGAVTGAMSATMDISLRKSAELQLTEMNKQLTTLAATDGLTGLSNQRAFREYFETAWKQAEQSKKPLSVILLDVDQFKAYNDTFGHVEGDDILVQIGQCLRDSVRPLDMVARYGGEEFIVLLPGADVNASKVVAERCRQRIESYSWPRRQVTASFGVATWSGGAFEFSQFVSLADRALYASKEEGRNRVTHVQQIRLPA